MLLVLSSGHLENESTRSLWQTGSKNGCESRSLSDSQMSDSLFLTTVKCGLVFIACETPDVRRVFAFPFSCGRKNLLMRGEIASSPIGMDSGISKGMLNAL